MSDTTSVPPIVFGDRGAVAPLESAIVTGLDADWNAAFDGDLNVDPSTSAGQIITSEAAIIGDNNGQQLFVYNNVDPAYASGRMQDAIARIYFLTRNPAQSTVLQVTCTGRSGVIIPVGSIISDPSGALYLSTNIGVIPQGGSLTLAFASALLGPFPVPSSVAIYQLIPGWDAVTLVSGVVGNAAEDRASFEARRQATVAANSVGGVVSVAGAVAKVPGVIDFYVTDNATDAPVTIGGVTLAANSLYACVAGGLAADVAFAIWTKKAPGCAYTGTTSVVVTDTQSGYSPPFPTYTVKFQIPTATAISFVVTIKDSPQVPSNAPALIQAAMVAAFLGQDGGTRARIGSEIFASRFYAGVAMLGTWAQIISILIGSDGSPAASFTGTIAGTALTASSGTGIAIGQFVYGASVAAGTIITAGSGTSWTVSVSQTVGSEAMTTVTANQNDVTMNINQIPTLAPADINVVLV